MHSTELLIAGAGPAGLSTAMHLVKLDPSWADRLVVLERTAHPRHKLCGGGVTRFGLKALRDLGLPLPLPLPQAPVAEARLVYNRRTIPVRRNPEFVVFQRAELDAYLAEQARLRGVTILEHTPVEALERDETGVTAATPGGPFHAQAVVGADGSRGLIRKLVEGRAQPTRVARLLEVITPACEQAAQFQERFAVFDFTPVAKHLQGYAWDFPSWVADRPRFNRGVYDARFRPQRPRAQLPRLLQEALEAWGDGAAEGRAEGHPIHWFSPRNKLSDARLLLVGDAAGAEPLFGEGIGPALAYGQVAAQALQSAFERQDFTFRDYRRRVLLSPLGRYLMLRWAIAWWSYRLSDRPWFMHALWTLGRGVAALTPRGEPLGVADPHEITP
jgi:flavin-dependent dehydrogenase